MFFSLDSTRYLSPYACTRSSTAGDAATPAMKEESKCAYVCVRVCIEGSFIIRVTYYEAIVDQQIPELLLLKHLEKEQTLRKDDKFRILRLLPVLEILQIIEERCVGKVLVLSQIVQVLRVCKELDEFQLCSESVPIAASRLSTFTFTRVHFHSATSSALSPPC